jgi:ElaB/YqjD/DUF883 family membrane-anchored ribosome-binding protein
MAVSNFAQEPMNKVTDGKACTTPPVTEAKGKVQEMAAAAAQTVQDVAADVSHKAQDWASNVANKAQETAAAAVDKTNDGIAAVGHGMNALGGTVREAAPRNGAMGSAATTMADQLQAGGRYLEGHGLQEMGKDLTAVVRQFPIQSILVGFAVGCVLGMTFRSMTARGS